MGTFTDGLLESTTPWPAWTPYLQALGAMFEEVWAIVNEQGSPDEPLTYTAGWSTLLDVNACPTQFLPYLGQFIGVYVPPGTPDQQARALIRSHARWARGTPTAITDTARQYLTATQSCILLERTPTPYNFQLVCRPEELPDATALTAAVNAIKPAGVTWTLIQTDGWIIYQMEAAFATITLLENAFPSITALEADQ